MIQRTHTIATLSLLQSILIHDVLADCYWPDGSLNADSASKPCNAIKGQVSMCCATNRTSDADTCLANGLCQNISPNGQNTGYDLLLWRESCSDPTWKSPYCLNLCTQGH